MIQALTLYGVPIPKAFEDCASARRWAEEGRLIYPGCRIVVKTATGGRTIWRDEPERRAA